MASWISLLLLVFATLPSENNCLIDDLTEAQDFLDYYNIRAQEEYYLSALAAWTYNTNLTDNNNQLYVSTDQYITEPPTAKVTCAFKSA